MEQTSPQSGLKVHQILAHSYLVYLTAVIFGFIANLVYPDKFWFPMIEEVGFLMILIGTAIVYWAQSSAQRGTSTRNADHQICMADFCVGPYKITRSPTHYGLFFMALGLSILYMSTFMVVGSIIAFCITRFIFIPAEERQLAQKYGEPYLAYKRVVRF